MEEELLIERKFGKPRPFKVPDGYFETLQSDIMAKLPVSVSAGIGAVPSRRPLLRRLRPLAWAASVAAVVGVAAVCLSGIFSASGEAVASASHTDMPQQSEVDLTIDELSDYAMMDNDDFYSFIADE